MSPQSKNISFFFRSNCYLRKFKKVYHERDQLINFRWRCFKLFRRIFFSVKRIFYSVSNVSLKLLLIFVRRPPWKQRNFLQSEFLSNSYQQNSSISRDSSDSWTTHWSYPTPLLEWSPYSVRSVWLQTCVFSQDSGGRFEVYFVPCPLLGEAMD